MFLKSIPLPLSDFYVVSSKDYRRVEIAYEWDISNKHSKAAPLPYPI
jgi:hypothetical protein